MIKLSNSATNLTPWQYIELSESYITLTKKQNVFYETLGLGVVRLSRGLGDVYKRQA